MQVKRRSSLWFLLPIVLNVVGGIISYFIIKEDDPKKAKNCLYLGLILAAIPVVLIAVPLFIGITLLPHLPNPASNMHYM
jgi:hypothetical protein